MPGLEETGTRRYAALDAVTVTSGEPLERRFVLTANPRAHHTGMWRPGGHMTQGCTGAVNRSTGQCDSGLNHFSALRHSQFRHEADRVSSAGAASPCSARPARHPAVAVECVAQPSRIHFPLPILAEVDQGQVSALRPLGEHQDTRRPGTLRSCVCTRSRRTCSRARQKPRHPSRVPAPCDSPHRVTRSRRTRKSVARSAATRETHRATIERGQHERARAG